MHAKSEVRGDTQALGNFRAMPTLAVTKATAITKNLRDLAARRR